MKPFNIGDIVTVVNNKDIEVCFKVGECLIFKEPDSNLEKIGVFVSLNKKEEFRCYYDRFILATPEAIQRYTFPDRLEDILK